MSPISQRTADSKGNQSEGRWRASRHQPFSNTYARLQMTELWSSDEVTECFQQQEAHFGKRPGRPSPNLPPPHSACLWKYISAGMFLCKIRNFFKCNNLFTEEKKDLSSVTVTFAEEMKRFYDQKMYVDSPHWPLCWQTWGISCFWEQSSVLLIRSQAPTVVGCCFSASSGFDGGSKKWYVSDTP